MVVLEEVTIINAPIERCFDLARDVEVHLEGNVRHGEQALASPPSGLIGMGERTLAAELFVQKLLRASSLRRTTVPNW